MKVILLVMLSVVLSGCYMRHWRHSEFCDQCLGNHIKPVCQAACDISKKSTSLKKGTLDPNLTFDDYPKHGTHK
jgi:hypothetical protein